MARYKYFFIVFLLLTIRFTGQAQLPAATDSLLYHLRSIKKKSDTVAIKGAFEWMVRSPEQVMLKDEVLQTIEKLRGIVEDKTYFDLAGRYFDNLEKINTPASNAAYLEKAKPVILQWSTEKSKYGRYSYLLLLRDYRLPFRNTGNLMGAIEFYSAYEKQFMAANDSAGVSIATNVLAGFYFRRGILERGKYYMLKSINYLNDLQEDYELHENVSLFGISGKLNRYSVLASFYLKEYKYEQAAVYLNEAMKYFRQLNSYAYFQDVPFFFLQMARCKTMQRNDSSRYFYDKSLFYLNQFNSPPLEFAGYYQELAADFISRNQLDSAMITINRAIHLKDSFHLPVTSYFSELLLGYFKAEILLKQGKPAAGIPLLEEEIKTLQQLNLKSLQLQEYKLLARLYNAKGQTREAYGALEKAIVLKEEIANNEAEARSLSFEAEKKMQESENTIQLLDAQNKSNRKTKLYLIGMVSLLGLLAIGLSIFYRNKKKTNRELSLKNERLAFTLQKLQATQTQLIQSEKMASLGELTAGIAHEIQNPLNFVNNFSELNQELATELVEEAEKGNTAIVKQIAEDIKANAEKINHHGKRADGIVKGMLQHSRSSSGQKELTDINALCDEYLRLAYHGWRAKDHSFNAKFETRFDESVGKINVIPQDLGRVILNLINNAFFAVNERANDPAPQPPTPQPPKGGAEPYEPTVSVTTSLSTAPGKGAEVIISIRDNGTGIPAAVVEKIFQPFFTTKPTGQGTGLGLSLSYDIITKGHGGTLKVETAEGEGTAFTITIPI